MHQKIYKKQIIEGVSIPAVIHNGNYYFVDLDVYENGRVYCWNFEDFEHFKNDVRRGWVVTSIPNGKNISIHNLGDWKIKNGKWNFDAESFIEYIEKQIREMNPHWENIYTHRQKIINGVRVGEDGKGTPYKVEMGEYNWAKEKLDGESFDLFYKQDGFYSLVQVSVFKDATLHICRIENPFEISLEKFEEIIKNGEILSQIPTNSLVKIYGLGEFIAESEDYAEEIENLLLEIKEKVKELNNEPTFFDICLETFEMFKENPTEENRQKLKEAYENVPEHTRMYLGDMDTRDDEYILIIEDGIEEWLKYVKEEQEEN